MMQKAPGRGVWGGVVLAQILVVAAAASAAKPEHVTLLLPGMKFHLSSGTMGFGDPRRAAGGKWSWTGLIGTLEAAGEQFGGVIRPRGADLSLPRCLDSSHTNGPPEKATFFVLDYSSSADVDGLAYKTLELSECIRQLRRYTGCRKVRLVAYSAGGLVARTYLQNALPQVRYRDDVERLVTIATPHLGSSKAEHFGDFLGTRATAIKPSSPLVWRLNNTLALPRDVQFASIVVRGTRIGCRKIRDVQEETFGPFVNLAQLRRLPLDYQKGCDQVVNVWSQNLALARCGRRYEAEYKRPIQFPLVRVGDPTPDDLWPFDRTVHDVAIGDSGVSRLVCLLLRDDGDFWTGLDPSFRSQWIQRQARVCAFGIVEDAMAQRHRLSEVYRTDITRLQKTSEKGDWLQFRFEGWAQSKWRMPPRIRTRAEFSGAMDLKFDRFGRIVECRYRVAKQ